MKKKSHLFGTEL